MRGARTYPTARINYPPSRHRTEIIKRRHESTFDPRIGRLRCRRWRWWRLLHQPRTYPLLHVDLKYAERSLVTLDRHLQGVQHPLGGEEVGDDSLGHRNRLSRNANRLGIEPKVDDQLLGRASHAAEVGIVGDGAAVIDLDRYPLLLLRAACGGGGGGGRWLRPLVPACLLSWPQTTPF